MWTVAEQLLALDTAVIFDVGLARRDHRDEARFRAAQIGGVAKLHYLDVDRETRRARFRHRNEERNPPLAPQLSEELFEWMERYFEPPSDDELYDAMIVSG
jgi:predicted kinase